VLNYSLGASSLCALHGAFVLIVYDRFELAAVCATYTLLTMVILAYRSRGEDNLTVPNKESE
jgi:dolichol kinase